MGVHSECQNAKNAVKMGFKKVNLWSRGSIFLFAPCKNKYSLNKKYWSLNLKEYLGNKIKPYPIYLEFFPFPPFPCFSYNLCVQWLSSQDNLSWKSLGKDLYKKEKWSEDWSRERFWIGVVLSPCRTQRVIFFSSVKAAPTTLLAIKGVYNRI